MKRLYVALALLAVVFAATLYHAGYLQVITGDMGDLLTRAEARAESGDWAAAGKLTARARQLWEDHGLYLHIFLRHSDANDVALGFREVDEYIRWEETGAYSAANARLRARIALLCRGEQLLLRNLL